MAEKFVVAFNSGEPDSHWFAAINDGGYQVMSEGRAIDLAVTLNGVGARNTLERRPTVSAKMVRADHRSVKRTWYGYVRLDQWAFVESEACSG